MVEVPHSLVFICSVDGPTPNQFTSVMKLIYDGHLILLLWRLFNLLNFRCQFLHFPRFGFGPSSYLFVLY